MHDNRVKPNNNDWRELKLFISSTFVDMQAERDYLIRFIFPKVRQELLKKRIHFIDIDLRWGISNEDDIIGACRAIIDDSDMFLGIIGGRYGFIPEKRDQKISVTDDEISYTIQNASKYTNRNFLFLMRSEDTTLSMHEEYTRQFREIKGGEEEEKLILLKKKIIQSGLNFSNYHAVWDDIKHSLINLNEFGQLVYNNIHNFVEQNYPDCININDKNYNEDDVVTEQFIAQRTQYFVDEGLNDILRNITTMAIERKNGNVIYLTGSCGIGKTAILCNLVKSMRVLKNICVIPHFIGVLASSSEITGTMKRICKLLSNEIQIFDPIPEDINELKLYFNNLLHKLDKTKHYILVIDALNQLIPSHNAHMLTWIPEILPQHVTLILSTSDEEIAGTIVKRWPSASRVSMTGMNEVAKINFINYFLSRYQKRLSNESLSCLISKDSAHIPLYLNTIIEELRIYGYHDSILKFINTLPNDSVSLFEWIIQIRIAKSREFVDERGNCISEQLIRNLLIYLFISQSGLSENELSEILIDNDVLGNVPALLRQLRSFLSYRGNSLTFYHDDFRKAVYNAYINNSELNSFHDNLAEYFSNKADSNGNLSWCGKEVRYYKETIFHYIQSRNGSKLSFLIKSNFLKSYIKLDTPVQCMLVLKSIIDFFNSIEGNYWNEVVHCMSLYAEVYEKTTSAIQDRSHLLEHAISQEDDKEVQTILAGFANEPMCTPITLAIKTLYSASGQEDKAQSLKLDPYITISLNNTTKPLYFSYEGIVAQNNEIIKKSTELLVEEKNTFSNPIPTYNEKSTHKFSKKIFKSHVAIPAFETFALMATGEKSYFIIFVYMAILFSLNKYVSKWIGPLSKNLIDYILLYLLPVILYFFTWCVLSSILEKQARVVNDEMISLYKNNSEKANIYSQLNLARHCRLLRESDIKSDSFDTSLVDFFVHSLSEHIDKGCYNEAGLLVMCCINTYENIFLDIISFLKKLPKNTLDKILYEMNNYLKFVFNPFFYLKFILLLYNYSPPVEILQTALALQNDVKRPKKVANLLKDVDSEILAKCILRSQNIPRKSAAGKNFEKIKSFLKSLFVKEPVPFSLIEFLGKIPFLILILFGLSVFKYIHLFAGLFLLSLFIIPLKYLFSSYINNEYIPKKIDNYEKNILSQISDFDSGTHKEGTKEGNVIEKLNELKKRSIGTASLETALIQGILSGKIDPVRILPFFSEETIIRVWSCLLREDFYQERQQLLSLLTYKGSVISAVLKNLNHTGIELLKYPNETIHKKQWSRMINQLPILPSVGGFTILSFLACIMSLSFIYIFSDLWLQKVIIERGKFVLLVTAGITVLPAIIFAITYLEDYFDIDMDGIFILVVGIPILPIIIIFDEPEIINYLLTAEKFIYLFIPILSISLTYKSVNIFCGRQVIYPNLKQRIFMKTKAIMIFVTGCVVIAVAYLLMIYPLSIFNNDLSPKPEESEISALKNYSQIVKLDINSGKSSATLISDFLINPWEDNTLEYRNDLLNTINFGILCCKTGAALIKFGYHTQGQRCFHYAISYTGIAHQEIVSINGRTKTIYLDINYNQVPVKEVITYIHPDGQAYSLGLQTGDIIQEIDNVPVSCREDVLELMSKEDKDSKIKVLITRNKIQKVYYAKPGLLGVILEPINSNYIK